jgi:hypothetical protein
VAKEFEWGRMYKIEESLEREAYESAVDYICEFYEVEDIIDLTAEQISKIGSFRDDHVNEYSQMYGALFDVMNNWESE